MHPFFNRSNRVLFLLFAWSLLTLAVVSLLSMVTETPFSVNLQLFTPLYFLCLVFIFPNYYLCRGLPLRQTSWSMLAASHVLTLLVIAGLWFVVGRSYVTLLTEVSSAADWEVLFNNTLYINITMVIIQFIVVVLMHYLYFALERTQNLEQIALKQELLISQAELQTLKATVHPHFLFNSLNTLSNIALSAPEQAHRFCLLIAEFLRYSVAYSKKNTATLDDELEHVQNYLGIERERFGARLSTDFQIDESLRQTLVPPLILFPIVENAIKHGIDSCIEGGELSMIVRRHEETLIIEISNPVDELGRKRKGTGHGLTAVEQRLRTRYGGKALLKTSRDNGRFIVRLFMPVIEEPSETIGEDN